MDIIRSGTPGNYSYKSNGKTVTDVEILDYIKTLIIPPNYRDVVIFYQKRGEPKILYQGYDSKDRLQRIYSNMWTKKAAHKKYCELLYLADNVGNISATALEHIKQPGLSKNKVVAMVIRLMMTCHFRIGNVKYQELYGSYGAMTIRKKHIRIRDGTLFISFVGKKAVVNSCSVTDGVLVSEIKKILVNKTAEDIVFQWDNKGVLTPLKAIEVNAWLAKIGPHMTSKDFRTYDTNILLIIAMRHERVPTKLTPVQRKKLMVRVVKLISSEINNTPAVLRGNYAAGGIIDLYINNPSKYERYFIGNDTPKQAFVKYLRDYCAV